MPAPELPEVAVARDAAARLSEIHEVAVDRCVVLYTTYTGKVGSTSYGRTAEDARKAHDLERELFAEARECLFVEG